ncbi:hypothetical protein [Novosphingobium sp.]|uniref:hypothetical protein n=1 Tax=Novosphingobium sp. TaxID=1874826 RepID=UPI001EBA8BC4|nr:hypothetical protein [Novosphingobium sp.]MBK9011114.1 hypothetical protein [Novosphingobium sp.]
MKIPLLGKLLQIDHGAAAAFDQRLQERDQLRFVGWCVVSRLQLADSEVIALGVPI